MALVGFSASAVQTLTYQNGDYMGSLNKKASGAQCFIMALGLFWDIVTGLPWTPNGVGSLGPRGYCIFLPGAHYLTINSPYGADSSLNKLLLLLLLLTPNGGSQGPKEIQKKSKRNWSSAIDLQSNWFKMKPIDLYPWVNFVKRELKRWATTSDKTSVLSRDHVVTFSMATFSCCAIFFRINFEIFAILYKFFSLGDYYKLSTRFVVKPEGGRQCIFDYFWLKLWGVKENLEGWEAPEGVKPPTPYKSSTVHTAGQ